MNIYKIKYLVLKLKIKIYKKVIKEKYHKTQIKILTTIIRKNKNNYKV